MITIAVACLAVAGAWRAALVLSDFHRIRRMHPDLRAYRPGLGWTDPRELDVRRRWAWAGLAAAAGLLPVVLLPRSAAAATVAVLSCAVVTGWILHDRRLHRARYTSVCIGILALGVLLHYGAELFTPLPARQVAGMFASFFAAQLYLVAGIRKLRSAQFMSGRVILDNLAYGSYQAAGGNREFIRTVSPGRLADLVSGRFLLPACRLAALATAVVELALGVGALGLFPAVLTLSLAVSSHLAFVLVSPRRIVPFTVAALGLLVLALAHPVLAGQA